MRLTPFLLLVFLLGSWNSVAAVPGALDKTEKSNLSPSPASVPSEAKLKGKEERRLQEELFSEFGILAVNKSDEHSKSVLKSLLFLLRNAFPASMIKELKSFRYLYAYKGHDRFYNMAAYHERHKAISIGGKSTYPGQEKEHDFQLLSTLAHEIGHAFIFQRLSPPDLRWVSGTYGGWDPLFSGQPVETSFYAKSFLSPHPAVPRGRRPAGTYVEGTTIRLKENNLTSGLATKNVHEWFADAFAAAALRRLGERELLGPDWQKKVISVPTKKGEHWVDYNNLSDGFLSWLEGKISGNLATETIQGP